MFDTDFALTVRGELASAIQGLAFPANREDIVSHARSNRASADVVCMLTSLIDGRFESAAAVHDAASF